MNPHRMMRLDVVVTNPAEPGDEPERDSFGDPVSADADPITLKGWYEQILRNEDTVGGDQQAETWRLFLVPEAAGRVSGSAKAAIGDAEFELHGPPWTATHPVSGQVTHVEATMKRVV